MENSIEFPKKINNTVTIGSSNPASGILPKKFESIYSPRYVHPCVHCSIINGGQDMETTEVPFDRGLDKDAGVHIHNGIHSAIGKGDILPFVAMWMEDVMPGEIRQQEKSRTM